MDLASNENDSDYQNISPNVMKTPEPKEDFPEEFKSSLAYHETPLESDRSRLSGTALKVGVVVLFGLLLSNYYLFRPYFTAILFSWLLSVPLHELKGSIHAFLVQGLEGRPEETAFGFVGYHIFYLFSQIVFGKVVTEWIFKSLDSVLFTKAPENKEKLKLRPVEQEGTPGGEAKVEKDPFQDLKQKDPTPPSPRESPSTKQQLVNIDALLQRPDWFYIVVVIRSCVILSLLKTLKQSGGYLIILLALAGGSKMLLSGMNTSAISRLLKKAQSPTEMVFRSTRLFLSHWIAHNTEDAVVMFLVLGVVFGMLYGGYTLVSSVVSEFRCGIFSYSGSLFRFGLAKFQSLLVQLAEGSEHLGPIHQHGDAFLKGQLESTFTVAEFARYLLSLEFFDLLAADAPVTMNLLQGSVDVSVASQIPQEIQAIAQSVLPKASSLISDAGKEMAVSSAVPALALFSSLTSNFTLNVALPYLLLALDGVFQVLVFTLTLWSLVARKASPLQPAQALLSKVWVRNSRTLNTRLFGHLQALIVGVCLSTFQMGLFHTLFSWFTLRLLGAPGACLFALLSGFIAVVPLGGPYIAILPSVQFMWFIEGRRIVPLVLFVLHFVTASKVDGAFYAHLPSVSSFYTALAAFLGYNFLGLQGLFYGPFLLALVPICYSEFLVNEED
ncbi:hypothetical protein DSO57_1037524 [Entomophthora muscae]|uniref:Uncharacterized protein n=1 Tax=Entomophthora muscae TaxID=34485 RepID=A0ACC2T9S2_9FUNG|nr:hypothetical protein DSO57_1037524 [Entomophthora muscae]